MLDLDRVVTKYDLYAEADRAQELAESGAVPDPILRVQLITHARNCLMRARRIAIATNDKASEDQAEAALRLARLFRDYGARTAAYAMYDEAFRIYAALKGESHKNTLEVQREYGMLLTVDHSLGGAAADDIVLN